VTKWVMIVSLQLAAPAGGSGTQYFIGDFDGEMFTNDYPDEILWLDYGSDNYAGTTWNNEPDGRLIYIAWMNNWNYANESPASIWRGVMTVPRELRVIETPDGYRLSQQPVSEITTLRRPMRNWQDLTVGGSLSIDQLKGRTLDLQVEFEVRCAARFGMKLHYSEDNDECIIVNYDVQTQQLTVTRPDNDLESFISTFKAPLPLHDKRIALRLLLDESTLEIFSADGLLSMTGQIFASPENDKVVFFADDGEVRIVSLKAYEMQGIWSAMRP